MVALRSVPAGALLGAGFAIRSHCAGVLAGHTLVARSTAVFPSHMVTSTVPLDNKYYVRYNLYRRNLTTICSTIKFDLKAKK